MLISQSLSTNKMATAKQISIDCTQNIVAYTVPAGRYFVGCIYSNNSVSTVSINGTGSINCFGGGGYTYVPTLVTQNITLLAGSTVKFTLVGGTALILGVEYDV